MKELTEKENRVLDYIIRKKEQDGYPPTVREIATAVGLKSTSTVQSHMMHLEQKGYIRRDPTKPRAVEILWKEEEKKEDELSWVPVIGDVAAGQPILAEQNIDTFCPVPCEEVSHDIYYFLKVHGNSMIKVGIHDGDKVLVKKADTAQDGQIVVALVDDSATIKRLYHEGNRFRLQPENDDMEPIYTDHVRVQGIIVEVLHKVV